jgi:hypothetical protein
VGSPDTERADTKADGPGIGIRSIFSSIALLMSTAPGSEIPGVPASEIRATERPECNFPRISSALIFSFSYQ